MPHLVKVLLVENLGNLTRILLKRPTGYTFVSGQACEIFLGEKESRPFTFISIPSDESLEFMIKSYAGGLTEKIKDLKEGDELLIGEAFGTIKFRGSGTFIAGGTGVNPFISILRGLKRENKIEGNKLLFSNKLHKGIIMEKELRELVDAEFILTREKKDDYHHGRLDKEFLKSKIVGENFYICGPIGFVVDVKRALDDLGVKPENIILEL